jgi:hypothetical protein
MDFTEVDSSVIDGVKLEGTSMFVKFKSGKVYEYAGVSQVDFDDLVNAYSAGQFYNQNIKGRFNATEVPADKPMTSNGSAVKERKPKPEPMQADFAAELEDLGLDPADFFS